MSKLKGTSSALATDSNVTDLDVYNPNAALDASENEEKISTTWFRWWAPEVTWQGNIIEPPIRGILLARGSLVVDEDERPYYVIRTAVPTVVLETSGSKKGLLAPVDSYINVGENYDLQVLAKLLPRDGAATMVTIIPRGQTALKGGKRKWNLEVRQSPASVEALALASWIEEVAAVVAPRGKAADNIPF